MKRRYAQVLFATFNIMLAMESRTTKVSYLAKNLIFIGIRRHNQAMQMSGNGLSLTLIHAHIQITKSSKWSDDWPAKLTAVSV